MAQTKPASLPNAPRKRQSARAAEVDTRLGPLRTFATPIADLKIQVRNWQRIAFLSIVVAGLSGVGLMLKSQQPTMLPYVVAIDKSSGSFVNVGVPPREDASSDILSPVIQYTIKQFIAGFRTVTPDQDMQNYLVDNYVKPFVSDSSQGAAMMNDFYKSNNPFDLGSKEIVTVDVDVPTPISASSYQTSWNETTEDLSGHVIKKLAYTGTVTTEFRTVPPDQQKFNPLGIYIKEIHWNIKSDSTSSGVK